MATSQLNAKKRDNSVNPRQLRSAGKLPATIYGKGMESVSLEMDMKEFIATYKKDKYAIFDLNVDNKNFKAVVKKVQMKPTTDNILNVEFLQIKEDSSIKMTIPVKTVGESPAAKAGGNLTVMLNEMEVECLPANIPQSIDIDISKLENYEDSITAGQISYPQGVTSTLDPEMIVAKVSAPKAAATEEAEAGEEGEAAVATEATKEA